MKRSLILPLLALSLLLTPPLTFPALAQDPAGNRQEILERIESARQKALDDLRREVWAQHELEGNAPSGLVHTILGDSDPDLVEYKLRLAAQSRKVAEAEAAYRETLTAEMLAATRNLSRQDAVDFLYHRDREVQANYQRIPENAKRFLASQLGNADTDAKRRAAYAQADSTMRAVQMEEEIVAAALRRQQGQDDHFRMKQLADRASGTKVTLRPSDIADPDAREIEVYFRKLRMEQQIAEYRRLAVSGRLTDPQTGQPLTGKRRLEVAKDAEVALANMLDARTPKPNRYDILAWTLSEPERRKRSKLLLEDIKETPEYVALDFMGGFAPGNVSGQFLAMSQAIRKQQQGVSDWRANFTKNAAPTGISAIDETINVLRSGEADLLRQANLMGTMSIDQVDARIARYNAEADTLVSALGRAARLEREANAAGRRVDMAQLPPETYALLKKNEYIIPRNGQEVFQIPVNRRQLGALKADLNLPGDHLLNMISGQNMAELAVMSYLPGAAAGRVGRLLEGAEFGAAAVRGGTIAADVLAGMALDAGSQYAKTGKVDAGRLAIEATMVQGAVTGLGGATGLLSRQMSGFLKNPQARKAAEAALSQSLGLGSEAALQAYFQSAMDGTGMSYEAFLGNMINGAMARGANGAFSGAMKQVMSPDLHQSLTNRHEVIAKRKQVAGERLKQVLGDDLAGRGGSDDSLRLNAEAASERVVARMDQALTRGEISWAELKMLYADNPEMLPLMKGVADHRAQYFQGLVEPAQRAAEQELNAEYAAEQARLNQKYPTESAAKRFRIDLAKQRYDAELALIRTAPRAPGSDNVTSDIDRSIASERVRKQLKKLYRAPDGQPLRDASSARSYDVNEYIDVFPVINKVMPHSADIAGRKVEEGEFAGLTHEQAVEAQSMATAMLHMNDAQRAQYEKNTLAGAKDGGLTRQQLDLARQSLKQADQALLDEMNRIARENPRLQRNPADLALRARDNLYGQRTEAIRKKALELESIETNLDRLKQEGAGADDPRVKALQDTRLDLMAEIQRDWGTTLREGIETYASFSGLDAIVNDGQIRKVSIRDLINDPDYRVARDGEVPSADNRLKAFSEKQLDGFMRDQVMMMTHHMNGFHEGHEGAVDAGSAMGKYAERAVLALKLQGKDLSKPPYDVLSEVSKKMVEARKDPAALKAYMEAIGLQYAGQKDADAGLQALADMIETAIPQTRGLWDAKAMGLHPHQPLDRTQRPPVRDLKRQLASRRHLLRDEEEARRTYGPASAAALNDARIGSLEQELSQLEGQKARRARLGGQYRPEDWNEAERLEAENAVLSDRIARMESYGATVPRDYPARQQLVANQERLRKLRDAYAADGGRGVHVPDEADARLEARIAAIKEELGQRKVAAEGYAQEQQNRRDRIAKVDLPEGTTDAPVDLPAKGFDPGKRGTLRISLNGQTLTLPIVPTGR